MLKLAYQSLRDHSMSFQRLKEISDSLIEEAGNLTFVRDSLLHQLTPAKQNVVILRGARGIGKSTLLQQYLHQQQQQKKNVLYISADNTLLQQTLSELAYEYQKRGGEFLVIDEIHKYNNWQLELKTIVDSFPKIKLLVSGSSSINLDYNSADLSRRHIMVHAQGLSFREYLAKEYAIDLPAIDLTMILTSYEDITHKITKELAKRNLDLLDAFKTYLRQGYFISRDNFPNETLYYSSLINTINSAIESDLPYTFTDINNTSKQNIKSLLSQIATLCPFTPNISELSKNLEIASKETLKKYLHYLDKGEIITNLYAANKTHKDFPKPKKIFLDNTNFSYAYADNPSIGTIRETFVANTLRNAGKLTSPTQGDFCLDNHITFEVGGKSKNLKQIKSLNNSFILADDLLTAEHRKIPIWLLGFLW